MPPKSKKSPAQLEALKRARSSSPAIVTDFEGALAKCQNQLAEAMSEIETLTSELSKAQNECTRLVKLQDKSKETIHDLKSQVLAAKRHQQDTYQELRNERRVHQRVTKCKAVLDKEIAKLKASQVEEIKDLEKKSAISSERLSNIVTANEHLQNELSTAISQFTSELDLVRQKLKFTRSELSGSKTEIYSLKCKAIRASQSRAKIIQKTRDKVTKERTTFYLLQKGVFSQETRNLVRVLVQANVSYKNIMHVIESVLATAGITAVGCISPRSVSRIVKEGYIAACIQLGYEMQVTEALTLSSDGTAHKNLNYDSQHAHYKVEGPDGEKTQVTCFLGLQRTLDGSSEEAVKEWDYQLQKNFNVFNGSPLATERNMWARLVDIYIKFAGMHADHCTKEKKNFVLMKEKKIAATEQILGEKRIVDDPVDQLMPHFLAANQAMMEKIGGQSAWDNLTEQQQNEYKAEMLAKLTTDLGKDSFEKLSDREQRLFKLFIWVGCGCHKDLNTVLGGYVSLSKFWSDNGLKQPVLLPNKTNAAIIEDKTADASESVKQAVLNSSCGAIKTTKIAGDILNNKNDKSGHHDQFRIWWKARHGTDFTFPRTSNNRFQSNCEAAAVLTVYREDILEYLKYAEQKKAKVRYSHMEKNLVKALNDIPTQTELAVLALYAQAVSHPYMKAIREDPTTNALDLGPLNQKIESFMVRLIEDPTFLVGEHVSYETGSFDGKPWRSEKVVKKINELAPQFPYLKQALVAFCKGAHETWKRFTSEYTPGGLIDEATQEEKDLAWMPSTNDVNEGALGQFRVMIRRQPQLTLLQYNARTMFARNNTAAFMDEMFTEDTHKYVRELARQKDTSEKDRLMDIVKLQEEKIAKKMAIKKKRNAKAAELANRISQVVLQFNIGKIMKLKGEKLRDQFDAFKREGAPFPKGVSRYSEVGVLKDVLNDAISEFQERKWQLFSTMEVEDEREDDGEYFEDYDNVSGGSSEEEGTDEDN
jgi:bacterioferritin-associated ferredoxin